MKKYNVLFSRPSSSRMRGSIQLLSILVLSAFLFAACGGDSGSNADSNDPVSSSSVKKSSSSKAKSSSSAKSGSSNGELVDDRDGQAYKTVKIGEQIWMAENLNLETPNSYCYNDSAKYCTKYGRLYTWAAVMDSAAKWSKNGEGCGDGKRCESTYPVRGVCPEGWHLPGMGEFAALIRAVGGIIRAGGELKSTSGWNDDYEGRSGNGTDAYAFSALPAGLGDNGGYYDEGNNADFWSSTEGSSNHAYIMELSNRSDEGYYEFSESKLYGLSVRCIQDDK